MTTQDKIECLKRYITVCELFYVDEEGNKLPHMAGEDIKAVNTAKSWLQELEQSNNHSNLLNNTTLAIKAACEKLGKEKIQQMINDTINTPKFNIDNWSNRELFDYCVENELCSSEHPYETWNSNSGRKMMLEVISTFKSQK